MEDVLQFFLSAELITILAVWGIGLFLTWHFIKSAVRSGVEEALQNTPHRTDGKTNFMPNAVKQGILDAMEELGVIEYKFYDKDGQEIQLTKKEDN